MDYVQKFFIETVPLGRSVLVENLPIALVELIVGEMGVALGNRDIGVASQLLGKL